MNPSATSAFTLIRFTLARSAGGILTQQRETLGSFDDAEAAFNTAKHRAWLALCHLSQDARQSGEGWELAVCDTEWGYDLRQNGQVVDRFWVHDRNSRQAL